MILKHIVKIDFLDTGLGLSSECINIYDYFYQNATAIYFHGNFLSDIGNYFELHWCWLVHINHCLVDHHLKGRGKGGLSGAGGDDDRGDGVLPELSPSLRVENLEGESLFGLDDDGSEYGENLWLVLSDSDGDLGEDTPDDREEDSNDDDDDDVLTMAARRAGL